MAAGIVSDGAACFRRKASPSAWGASSGRCGPTLVGVVVAITGSYPLAITAVSMIYLLGLPAIAFAPETAERPLPA